MQGSVTRRGFLGIGAGALGALAGPPFFALETYARDATKYSAAYGQLDAFVEQYMRAMNAPGMTLVMADRDGVQRVVTYGFGDTELKTPVSPGELFQIGSISKSLTANCVLQLAQEGKLDLQKPILDYLPWLRIDSSFAPITVHHMLTHSSGLPGNAPIFLSDPAAKHRAATPPGQYFHYNNMMFAVLGHLVATIDGREFPEVLSKRILEPLAMTQAAPVITLDMRSRLVKSYQPFTADRPYPRFGRLCEAPGIIFTEGAGCVAATAHDMGLYIQMIASHGAGPQSRLLTEDSFALFSTAHIKAEEFGPTASYGYGIAVDTLDGHRIVRHTGGMVSFASALHVDIDQGVGAFASINAMQGYRPNPPAQVAIRLMRALAENNPAPSAPATKPAAEVENAQDYAGTYSSPDGRVLEFMADGSKLVLMYRGSRVSVEKGGDDQFTVLHPDFERFLLLFGRADSKDPQSSVVEAGWGGDWYANSKYQGPTKFESPAAWNGYVGHYRNENPWIGSVHVVLRKDRLMLDGVVPLEPGDGGIFRLRDEEHSPEWVQFTDTVNGKAMRLKFSGEDLWRVTTA